MSFAFVILHYLAPEVTEECIDLILNNFSNHNINIIVVDNCSPDGSGQTIAQRYRGESRLHLISMPSNEGFARGNNAGYRYAVANLDPDFVIVMNNDVMIRDSEFLHKITRQYASRPFAVLGPDIWSPKAQCHQSPARPAPLTLREARRLRIIMKIKQYLGPWLTRRAASEPRGSDPLGSGKLTPEGQTLEVQAGEGYVLHGACYIFSRDFTAVRTDAFNPGTFLYVEEDILAWECLQAGLEMRYCPDITVEHLEDVSTNKASGSAMRKTTLKYRRVAESLGVLIDVMKGKS